MAGFLYKLGPIVFNTSNISPTEVERSTEYRWAAMQRLIRRPAHQWIGSGMDEITFDATIYPSYDPSGKGSDVVGVKQVDDVRDVAEQGLPLELYDGSGNYYGRWVIKSIEEKREVMLDNGAPLKQSFSMKICRYGEDDAGERSIIYKQKNGQGVFTAPRIPAAASSPGAGSPAIIRTSTLTA